MNCANCKTCCNNTIVLSLHKERNRDNDGKTATTLKFIYGIKIEKWLHRTPYVKDDLSMNFSSQISGLGT